MEDREEESEKRSVLFGHERFKKFNDTLIIINSASLI